MAREAQTKSSPAAAQPSQKSVRRRALFSFERISQPIATRRVFITRMAWSVVVWFGIMLFGLAVGISGYAYFEGMGLVDAYLNAAMILSGMGPVGELHSTAGKVFAGSYAIFSGLVIVIATGVVLAPIIHHVLHVFHVDTDDKN
jgi:surface polysaccharide O-acyltransferase-like enzyme